MTRWIRCTAFSVGVLLVPGAVHAAPGDPIATNDYNVELFQGPVLAPLRVTGLAGAYAAYAEGIDGLPTNPASPAVREPFSVYDVDWDIAFSVAFPSIFGKTDFDNDGRIGFTYEDFIFLTAGGMLQVGPFGIGATGDVQRYNLTPNANPDAAQSVLTLGKIDMLGAWAVLDHQLIVGGGARVALLNVDTEQPGAGSESTLRMFGISPEVGVVIRPDYQPWRIGAAFRAPVEGTPHHEGAVIVDAMGVRRAPAAQFPLAIPQSVHVPWEVSVGFAIQVGPRPLNPKWIDPAEQESTVREKLRRDRETRRRAHDRELAAIRDPAARARRAQHLDQEEQYIAKKEENRLDELEERMLDERRARYWNWPREHILVVAEALITGPSPNAVSVESFLSQTEQRAGKRATVTSRLGLEGEPVVGWIKTRFGTYIEPARFAGRAFRQHFTFGFDVRVFEFKGAGIFAPAKYRISGVTDLAPRYQNFGVSFGAWH